MQEVQTTRASRSEGGHVVPARMGTSVRVGGMNENGRAFVLPGAPCHCQTAKRTFANCERVEHVVKGVCAAQVRCSVVLRCIQVVKGGQRGIQLFGVDHGLAADFNPTALILQVGEG
jgi:hypothetical protein